MFWLVGFVALRPKSTAIEHVLINDHYPLL